MSTCSKCNGTMFKVVEKEPVGSNFKVMFVQCSSCGVPIGVLDYYNLGSLLQEQKKLIEALASRVSNVEHSLNQIAYFLQQR